MTKREGEMLVYGMMLGIAIVFGATVVAAILIKISHLL